MLQLETDSLIPEPVLWIQPHPALLPAWARTYIQIAAQPTIFAKIFLWVYTFEPTKIWFYNHISSQGKSTSEKYTYFFTNEDRFFPLPRLQTDGVRSCQGTIVLREATSFLNTQTASWNQGQVCNLKNQRIYEIKYRLLSMHFLYILAWVINILLISLLFVTNIKHIIC